MFTFLFCLAVAICFPRVALAFAGLVTVALGLFVGIILW